MPEPIRAGKLLHRKVTETCVSRQAVMFPMPLLASLEVEEASQDITIALKGFAYYEIDKA
jgi:hypothetical protein